MGLCKYLNGGIPKLWKVEEHRVKKEEMKVGESTVLVDDGPPSFNSHHATKPEYDMGFMCVDCEKKFQSREEFKDEECYEVIEDGT